MSRRMILIAILLLVFCAGLANVAEAQSTTTPTIPPTSQPTEEVYVEFNYSDWRIAFLVTEGELPDDYVVTPQRIADSLGDGLVAEVNDWDTFLELEAEKPFDALIIHESALPFVDNAWTQDAYRRGVVMVVINIYYPELADLLLPCKSKEELPDPDDWYPEGHDFHMNFHLSFALVDKTEREEVMKQLEDCVPWKAIHTKGGAYGSSGGGESLEEHGADYGFRILFSSLKLNIESKKFAEYMERTGDFTSMMQ
jgi:hypothetical protein